MIRQLAILGVAALTLSAALAGPGLAAQNRGGYSAAQTSGKKKPPVCYEQGCTGDKCIICTR